MTTEPSGREADEFERYPALASWIERLANTPNSLSLGEWMIFLGALNQALRSAATPSPLLGNRSGLSGNHIEAVRAGADAPSNGRYRKRPVVIDAVQFTGSNCLEVIRFMGGPWTTLELHDTDRPVIHTLEGEMTASPGDWIIKGVKGEFYPCKPDIFAATYEPEAADAAPLAAGPEASQLGDSGPNSSSQEWGELERVGRWVDRERSRFPIARDVEALIDRLLSERSALEEERDRLRAKLENEGWYTEAHERLDEHAREQVRALEERVRVAEEALERIERWFGEFPDTGRTWDDGSPMSYSACFGSNGERDFMRGIAREALAQLSSLSRGSPETIDAWAWLSGRHNLSLNWHGPVYGDDDDDAEEWRVYRESGGINDREWETVGVGATALDAVLAARRLLAADAAPLAAGPEASQLGDSGPSHEDLLSERSALEERVRELEAIAGLARELVSPAGMVNRGVDRGLVVIERADKSDPHYRLCTALAQLSTSLSETGEGEG